MADTQKAPSLVEALKLARTVVKGASDKCTNSDTAVIHTIDAAIAAHKQQQNELLAACKAVEAEAKDWDKDGDITISSNAWDLLTQAIAKAEGK